MTFDDFCGQERIGVREEALPSGIYGFTKRTADGYVVILNACLDDCRKKQVLGHELAHILYGHLDLLHSEIGELEVRENIPDLVFE